MKKKTNWIWFALWGLICLVGGGGTLFSWMPRTPGMFYGGCAMLVISAILGPVLLLLAKGKTTKKAATAGLIFGAGYAVVIGLVLYLCDKVIFADSIRNYQPVHSSLITVVLNFGLIAALCLAVPDYPVYPAGTETKISHTFFPSCSHVRKEAGFPAGSAGSNPHE